MQESLKSGLKVDFSYTVPAERTVPHLLPESDEFALMPKVLATGYMVGLMEWACIVAVNPHLDWPREQTVGIAIRVNHSAATPPGLTVNVQGRLEEVKGRRLLFSLQAHDGVDLISRGTHERYVINAQEFSAKALAKGGVPPQP